MKALCLFAAVFCVGSIFVVLQDPVPAKCRGNHAAGTCIPGLCKTCSSTDDKCCCITTQHCKCVDPTCEKMK